MTIIDAPTISLDHKHLIDEALWDRLVGRIMKDHAHRDDMTRELAERIMNEALGFLLLCATQEGRFSPSAKVDIGWHAFLMYTKPYAEFCQKIAGRFIHHEPNDDPDSARDCDTACAGCESSSVRTGIATTTVQAMRDAGLAVDEELWGSRAFCGGPCGSNECNQDHPC